jgi:rhamnose utilization protein RhaD (predicted bifunctional aldolase and dehydrogenase)
MMFFSNMAHNKLMSLQELAEISRYYGSNPDYVIAGGGNTSFKDNDTLYIKASGTSLGEIKGEDFVKMDRRKLARIWQRQYPQDVNEREAAVLADMMTARKSGEENKRPSVETLLHDLLPFSYVVHTHPCLVNGLTCSKRGEEAAAELFADEYIWIPSINPGYILSQHVKNAMDEFIARGTRGEASGKGKPAEFIFLQNHGVFVAGNSVSEIKETYRRIISILEKHAGRKPDFSDKTDVYENSKEIASVLEDLAGRGSKVLFERNKEFARLVQETSAFYPVSSAFTPDHIVYAGSDPLFIGQANPGAVKAAWKDHVNKIGRAPKIAAVKGLGVFGIGVSEKTAALALALFEDTAKVAAYTEPYGGPAFMSKEQIDFINNWEVEQYRSKIVETK